MSNNKLTFNRGQIDRLYTKLYEIADKLSNKELVRYCSVRHSEFTWLVVSDKDCKNRQPKYPAIALQMLDYKNKRLKFHLEQMRGLLEVYSKAKTPDGKF